MSQAGGGINQWLEWVGQKKRYEWLTWHLQVAYPGQVREVGK